ncbi:MAG TPA: AraC family transcriptional regulator [Tepidisphaeraceae bacterium]|jgi:AraC-like DNA-binding protein|nr:AraC family transcriptional regulator [Tepidisphaeraceae bacterium]
MTEFSTETLGLLADAIYGGPRVATRLIVAMLDEWSLALPVNVIAVDWPASGTPAPRLGRRSRVLRVHPGIAYVLVGGSVDAALTQLRERGAVTGDPQQCAAADRLVWTIQEAVLSLRRRQLGPEHHELTHLAEVQARALALHRLRTGHAAAPQALDAWSGIVLSRHRNQLNTVRRKFVEALCLLTLDSDNSAIGYPFQARLAQLLQTFSLPATADVFRAIVAELLPVLRRDSAQLQAGLVGDAQRYIAEHFTRDIGLAQVAKHLGCSPTHLSRAFRQRNGQTLTHYLQSQRVSRAKALLLETDSPLRVIAPAAGFQSIKHYHRTFLKQTGLTPQAFRAL